MSPRKHLALSVAAIPIEHGVISVARSYYQLIRQQQPHSGAVTIHGLTAADMAGARAGGSVISELLELLSGAVLLGHNVRLDWGFLHRLLVRNLGAPLLIPALDTLCIEASRLAHPQAHSPAMLSLAACRGRHALPDFEEHDARNDAFATAELFLAQVAAKGGASHVTLRDLGVRWLG